MKGGRVSRDERELLKLLVLLLREAVGFLEIIAAELAPSPPTDMAVEAVTGGLMPVDVGGTTTATTVFQDNNGDPAAAPTGDGSGLSVTYNVSDITIATVGPATLQGDGSYQATITGVAEGTYTLNTAVENTSGIALLDDDGATPFIQPAAVDGTVGAAPAGQAVTAVTTIA